MGVAKSMDSAVPMESTDDKIATHSTPWEPWQDWGSTARYLVIYMVQLMPYLIFAWQGYVHR